jgi:hypothetical protein
MSQVWKPPGDDSLRRRLSGAYGFQIPQALIPLVRLALRFDLKNNRTRDAKPEPVEFITAFDFSFDFDLRFETILSQQRTLPSRTRYIGTPPEYFALGWLGTDGVSRGYLVHAPELAYTDYPIVEFQPIGSEGLMLLGATTRSGLEGWLSREMVWWESSDKGLSRRRVFWESIIQQIGAEYDIQPHAQKNPPITARCMPEVPDGWRYEATADGVGVLAPSSTFAPYPAVIADWGEPLLPVLQSAQRALDGGYPATALHGLRASYHANASLHPAQQTQVRQLLKLWQVAYTLLERPLLAKVIQRYMLPLWSKKRAKD